jgi:hypothetical protein
LPLTNTLAYFLVTSATVKKFHNRDTWLALADEVVDSVQTLAAVLAGVLLAVVDVRLAVGADEACKRQRILTISFSIFSI